MVQSPTAQQFYGLITGNVAYGAPTANNLTTSILDSAAGIAYVNVRQFNHYNIPDDKAIMMDFYSQISDFNHLIIDLRGNGGGFTRYFVQLFMAPIIPYDVNLYINTLIMGGALNRAWTYAIFADDRTFRDINPTKHPLTPTDFPHLHPSDAAKLDYVIPYHVHIASTGQNLFNGQIWILVDHNSASAVEYALLYSIAADFATIVGTPTRGVTGGGLAAFFPLPHTGLIIRYDYGYFIDVYGRAIDEFGVIPHYPNLPGLDALQTVLYFINENR